MLPLGCGTALYKLPDARLFNSLLQKTTLNGFLAPSIYKPGPSKLISSIERGFDKRSSLCKRLCLILRSTTISCHNSGITYCFKSWYGILIVNLLNKKAANLDVAEVSHRK